MKKAASSEGIDFKNPLDLGQQSVEQPKVTAADADDDRNCFRVERHLRELHPQRRPVLLQQPADLWRSERPELMDKADAGIELRIASQTLFEARHADQDKAEVATVVEIAELFQAGHFEPISFIDNQ
jgi:hypothetical protein